MDLERAVQEYLELLPEREKRIKTEGGNYSDWHIEVALRNLGKAFAESIGLPLPLDSFEIWNKEQERLASVRRYPSNTLRQEIYERDGFKCLTCATTENLCTDHVVPFSRGGLTVRENLQTLCRSCNSSKGARE
jgi:hypothetical protein